MLSLIGVDQKALKETAAVVSSKDSNPKRDSHIPKSPLHTSGSNISVFHSYLISWEYNFPNSFNMSKMEFPGIIHH